MMYLKLNRWSVGFVVSILLAGCLKDKDYDEGRFQATDGSETKVISLGVNYTSARDRFAAIEINNGTKDTVIDLVPVELGGKDAALQDLHITVESVDSLVDNYNEAEDTDYEVPQEVRINNPEVRIAKGTRTGFVQVKLIPNALSGRSCALGIRIKSIAEPGYVIGSNVDDGVVALVVKDPEENE